MFGGRTHAEFLGQGNTKLFLLPSIKKLIVDQLEQNILTLRSWTDPHAIGVVKVFTYSGINEVYCYESSHYCHKELFKAKEALDHYIQTIKAECDVIQIKSSFQSKLIASTSKQIGSGLEIIDSCLIPFGVFADPDCIYSATEDNLNMLLQFGHRFFVSGETKLGQWKPRALCYGKAASYSISSTWWCTVTGAESNNALILLLKQARLAVASAIEREARNDRLHLICHFSSSVLQRLVDAVLCDEIGFEPSDYTPFYGNYSRFGIYEHRF